MMYHTTKQDHPYMLYCERKDQFWDSSFYEDPRVYEAYEKMGRVLGVDDNAVAEIMREIGPVLLESAWGIWLPTANYYTMWWPWLNNYYAVEDIGYCGQGRHWTFAWIDEDLKASMGY
jgi:hypothetical protein